MLDTREAAMMEANDFQDSLGLMPSSEKCDIPLTISHSRFTSWAAANSPMKSKIICGNKYYLQLCHTPQSHITTTTKLNILKLVVSYQ